MSVRGRSLASAANCVASRRGSAPLRSSDQSASGCSLPRLKTTSRASTPRRRSACTFSHGIPATLTGACVTRSLVSGTLELELVEVPQRRPPRPDARGERAQLVVRDLADRALDAEVGEVEVILVDDRGDPRVDLDH